MRINTCHISGLACFDELELSFPKGNDPTKADVYMFVGTNGTGKSSILQSLAQFFSFNPIGLDRKFRSEMSYVTITDGGNILSAISPHSEKSHRNITTLFHSYRLNTKSQNGSIAYYNTPRVSPEEYIAIDEYRQLSNNFQPHAMAQKNIVFSYIALAYSGQRSVNNFVLEAIVEQRDNPFANACSFRNPSSPQQLIQWIANCKAKEAFALAKGDMNRCKDRHDAVARIEEIIRNITGREFSFVMNDEPLGVGVKFDNATVVDLDVLPDGLKSIISWIADLLMRTDRIHWNDEGSVFKRRFILFLDEIEVHLHPAWQRKILPIIQSLFPNSQIFISTHSPFVIASASNAWIYLLKRGEMGVTADPPIKSDIGSSYTTILREIMGVNDEFSIDVQSRIDKFYQLKRGYLSGNDDVEGELEIEASYLMQMGAEISAIIGREMIQIKRIKNKGHDK